MHVQIAKPFMMSSTKYEAGQTAEFDEPVVKFLLGQGLVKTEAPSLRVNEVASKPVQEKSPEPVVAAETKKSKKKKA